MWGRGGLHGHRVGDYEATGRNHVDKPEAPLTTMKKTDKRSRAH